MGGPVAGVLLRRPLSQQQEEDLEHWLREHTSNLERSRLDWYTFFIRDGSPLGMTEDCSTVQPCRFGLSAHDPANFVQEVEQEQVVEALGYYPQQKLSIDAGCNRSIDHRILGHLTLLLAERYDGLIDMNGAITPPLQPGRRYKLNEYPWHAIEEIHEFVQSQPGRVIEVLYEVSPWPWDTWVYHIVDTAFLRAWLKHPYFHMIK